jgi:NADPH-dependent 2,4-dienoyl-CoA reductase/sulfur reductase-like enzyme/nitrite reductase/ring-hydroxylating ferredoxin subunit
MSEQSSGPSGPDLSAGIAVTDIPEGGMLAGHVNDQPVLLARISDEIFAIGAQCTHYGGPLGEGLMVGDTVRCPWHHACFSVRTGEAVAAPALNPVSTWEIEREGDRVRVVRENSAPDGATPKPGARSKPEHPKSIVIVGAGAAGNAAAEMLRRDGYAGPVTMIGADPEVPYDRPNLSKDYLAGNAQEEWIPLRSEDFYSQHKIDLIRNVRVESIDRDAKTVKLSSGETKSFDKLLLATGAEPVRLPLPGGDLSHVHYLRTLADSRAIISAAESAKKAVVIGASFIGLEVAASLRTRGLEVDVVGLEKTPLERVVGAELGSFVKKLHESKGVKFHLENSAASIDTNGVTLESGEILKADLVVIGVGVRPSIELAEKSGLSVDKGVSVDGTLKTSDPDIYAAGDIARFPDPRSGQSIRVEHWVVAERQGQTAARNMLGANESYDAAPFFWSQHYDASILYVGHAEKWDELRISGNIEKGDAAVEFKSGGKTLAVATLNQQMTSLEAERALDANDEAALGRLFNR